MKGYTLLLLVCWSCIVLRNFGSAAPNLAAFDKILVVNERLGEWSVFSAVEFVCV